jgi:hypothetical protein
MLYLSSGSVTCLSVGAERKEGPQDILFECPLIALLAIFYH